MASKKIQLTLAIIKPDLTPFRFAVLSVRDRILESGFVIADTREDVRMDRATAEAFYAEHKK